MKALRRSTSQQKLPDLEVRLRSHAQTFSTQDLIVNPDVFACRVGDILSIAAPGVDKPRVLLLQITDTSKVKGNVQISISNFISDIFSLPETVRCQVIKDPSAHYVDFVALSIKGTYVGRGEMHKLFTSLHGKPLYLKQTIALSGLRVQVSNIWSGETKLSGIVAPHTKVVFRSKSARLFLFLQISREMMQFDEEGDLYFEKAVKVFLADLFKRWNAGDYDHALSIVLFSRSFFAAPSASSNVVLPPGATLHRKGSYFVDYYREVVHMENRADWLTVIPEIKVGFSAMRQLIAADVCGVNSLASEGNFLEAINLALNVFDKHYVDRDLRRTGQQIIVVTAGNGHFDVDPQLSKLTKRRMMEGIGCDVMCLGPRPLHAVPFFRLFHHDGRVVYHVPSWFYVGYVQRRGQENPGWSCRVREIPFLSPNVNQQHVLVPCNEPNQLLLADIPDNCGRVSRAGSTGDEDDRAPSTQPNACNPFSNEKTTRIKPTASKRRWTNVYHSVEAPLADSSQQVAANPNYRGLLEGINWDSITEPASLPLTTDYFPPDNTLKTLFTEHPYTMSLIPLENQYDDNPRLLLKELVYQRLVHGYQIVPQKSRMFSAEEASDRHGLVASIYYLSMAQDFQIILYDPLVSPYNVEVKIFHKIEDKDAAPQFEYLYNFWSDSTDKSSVYRKMTATFRNDKMNYRLWNVLDRFIAGQVPKDAFPLLKYWRVGFILIANAAASRRQAANGKGGNDVEWRKKAIENFNAFREFLETTRLAKGQAKREMDITVPGFALTVTGAPGEVTGGRGKLDPSEISALAKRMAIDSNLIQDHRKGLRTYRDAMLGQDCIEFVLANVTVALPEEAQNLALTMVQWGMLSILRGGIDDFGNAVVKLVRVEPIATRSASVTSSALPVAASPTGVPSAPASNPAHTGPQHSPSSLALNVSSAAPPSAPMFRKFQRGDTEISLRHVSRRNVEPPAADIAGPSDELISMSTAETISDPLLSMRQHPTNAEVSGGPTAKSQNKMIVNMESSDRYEWLYVAHDKTYHPNRTFYLVLEWTSCTGGAVHDFVQLLSRKAKSCNMDLIQIPLNFYQRSDPFFVPVDIPFNVDSLTDEECEAFQSGILGFSSFLLMQASSFEWVHASGAAFVAVTEHRWFQWYFNSLMIERDKGVAAEAKQLLQTFRATVNKFERAFSGDKSVFSFEDSADIFTLLSYCPPLVRPKLEALAVSAGLVSMETLDELLKSR